MKLGTLIRQLASIELKEVNLGSNLENGVTSYNYERIIDSINMGLLDLYTRFPLKLREVFVQQYEQIQFYKLHSDFAESNTASTQPIKYIVDGINNIFDDRILKIDAVYDECGISLPIDEPDMEGSVFLTAMDTVQVPCPSSDNNITVIYRAAPTELAVEGSNILDQEVEIPLILLRPLKLFVAYVIHASNNFLDSAQETSKYYQMYEAACMQAKIQGVGIETKIPNIKLEINGWV